MLLGMNVILLGFIIGPSNDEHKEHMAPHIGGDGGAE